MREGNEHQRYNPEDEFNKLPPHERVISLLEPIGWSVELETGHLIKTAYCEVRKGLTIMHTISAEPGSYNTDEYITITDVMVQLIFHSNGEEGRNINYAIIPENGTVYCFDSAVLGHPVNNSGYSEAVSYAIASGLAFANDKEKTELDIAIELSRFCELNTD